MMGNDTARMAFFQAFVAMMQKKQPDFGKGCYVDSTHLPNDICDNLFNELCCHGVFSSEVMIAPCAGCRLCVKRTGRCLPCEYR